MTRASISIFSKKVEYTDNRSIPETPPEVFEAAQRIAEAQKGCEIVRSKTGLYVVAYSETGPSNQKAGWEDWLPVYVAKVSEWSSGGIRQNELKEYKENKNEDQINV